MLSSNQIGLLAVLLFMAGLSIYIFLPLCMLLSQFPVVPHHLKYKDIMA